MHSSTEDLERIDLDRRSPWWAEHRARYHWAASRVRDGQVLDVACGSGLGAEVLVSAGARFVLGMELAAEALQMAVGFRSDRFQPCQGDGTRLPVPAGTFPVITSFETVEHVPDDALFVAELARALRPDGVLLLSTPNALHTKPVDGIPSNPFHVREYEPEQLRRLLETSFEDVRLLGQQPVQRHRPCPYWQSPESQGSSLRAKLVAASWKAHGRLPGSARDMSWRTIHRRSYFPGEADWEFSPEAVRTGHVLVAECRRPRPRSTE